MHPAGPALTHRRITIAAALSIVAFAILGLRLLDLTIFPEPPDKDFKPRPLVTRADLVDRNGELLARDLPVHDLYAQPAELRDRKAAAHELALATGASQVRLERLFTGKHKYVLVYRQLAPEAEATVRKLDIAGLEYAPAMKRYYPKGLAAVQVIGSTDIDGNGLSGLEYGLNSRLEHASPGSQVVLSLDMRVQFALKHEVEAAREEFSARAGGGIVMNVDTGEILAMASLPDAETPGVTEAANPRRNRMAEDDYELGSVFKIFSFAMAMQDHTITLDRSFPIGKGFKIGKYLIGDAEKMPDTLKAEDIFALSSNAGTAQIVLLSGPDRQRAFLNSLGLLARRPTEIPESAAPLLPRYWGQIQTATIGFGHGISVSPLSFVTAAAVVVNGGRWIEPTFLKHTADARGRQVISPATSEIMRSLLRYVVTNGTGKKADVPGYDVGGKTGSAEKAANGRYVAHRLLTSFCAVFPISNPRYLVFVMLDEPHGTKETGGWALAGYTAAPLAGRVIARIAPMLGMPASGPVLAEVKSNP